MNNLDIVRNLRKNWAFLRQAKETRTTRREDHGYFQLSTL